MGPPSYPFIVRLAARAIPAGYREEVLGDLVKEYATIRLRRGGLYAFSWILLHVGRSAVAARRHRPEHPRCRRDVRLLIDELAADWSQAWRSSSRPPARRSRTCSSPRNTGESRRPK